VQNFTAICEVFVFDSKKETSDSLVMLVVRKTCCISLFAKSSQSAFVKSWHNSTVDTVTITVTLPFCSLTPNFLKLGSVSMTLSVLLKNKKNLVISEPASQNEKQLLVFPIFLSVSLGLEL